MNKIKQTSEFEKRVRYLIAQLNIKNFDKPEGMYCAGKFYYKVGKTYVKIIQGYGSVKFFIHTDTGAIYKSKSHASANMRYNFGNINNEDFGLTQVARECIY